MSLNLTSLIPPLNLRPAVTLTDEERMRLSKENKPYKIDRNKYGDLRPHP